MRNVCVKHRVGGSAMCSDTITTILPHEPAFLPCQNMVQGPKRHAQWSHVPCQQDYWTLACKIERDFVRPFPCQRHTLCGVTWELTHLATQSKGHAWHCPVKSWVTITGGVSETRTTSLHFKDENLPVFHLELFHLALSNSCLQLPHNNSNN